MYCSITAVPVAFYWARLCYMQWYLFNTNHNADSTNPNASHRR